VLGADHPENGRCGVRASGHRAELPWRLLPVLHGLTCPIAPEGTINHGSSTLKNLLLNQGAEVGGEVVDQGSNVHRRGLSPKCTRKATRHRATNCLDPSSPFSLASEAGVDPTPKPRTLTQRSLDGDKGGRTPGLHRDLVRRVATAAGGGRRGQTGGLAMPKDADFKKLVRARMAKTGESYSIARMRISAVGANDLPGVAGIPDALAIYQVKVAVVDIEPEIWRRLLVPAATTLDRFHAIIQATFGWWDYHLHQFVIDGRLYGDPAAEYADELPPMTDERDVTLADIVGATHIVYEYDFGDDWKHSVVIESVALSADPTVQIPGCVGGARACPHEDCGGTSGYQEMLEILRDPAHEEHRSIKRWAGRGYHPEKFDLAATNRALRKLRSRARPALRRGDARA
jgi:Plasmid pRiA4b ORF-3-like protein